MKLSKLHTKWLILRCFWTTGFYSLKAFSKSLTGKPSRPWVDQLLDDWVSSLLNLVKTECILVNPHQVEIEPGKPTIIMCNHSSAFDIPICYKAFPMNSMRMLAKIELSRVPLLGRGMRAAEFPFVDRKNRNQAMKDMAYARELMESGVLLWISPEGTRSMTGKLQPFKKGGFVMAINTNATIIPIAIRGAFNIMPPKTFRLNLNQKAEIHIGEPVNAADYSLDDKEELLNLVYRRMKALAGESDPEA